MRLPEEVELCAGLALARSQRGPRLLLVKSNLPVFSRCLQMVESLHGVVTVVAADDEVIRLIEQPLFDVVLLDLEQAPDGEGDHAALRLLEKIRQVTIELPIVVLTGSQTMSTPDGFRCLSHAVKLGIQGVVGKPLCRDEFQSTVADVIQKHQRDTANRWNVVQQIVQNEKLAIAGRLVTSLAHEMNNPLHALNNALHLLGKRTFNGRKRQQYQAMAQKETENLIAIVRRTLDFYRPSAEGMRPVNLNNLLEGVLRRVDPQLHESNVLVLRDWYPRIPDVFAIGSRIKQVCFDLIHNAIQSMPNGGVLTIRTYATDGTEYQINAGVEFKPSGSAGHSVRGPSVVLEISDTGMGIAPDELPKVFEPFYTTRIKATGLGLAISYSIVEQHRGELSVSSTQGQGTTVRVRLPAAT